MRQAGGARMGTPIAARVVPFVHVGATPFTAEARQSKERDHHGGTESTEEYTEKSCRGTPCGCPDREDILGQGTHKGCPYTLSFLRVLRASVVRESRLLEPGGSRIEVIFVGATMIRERFLILTDGQLGVFSSKTATSVLRYRPADVAAVLDREHAGESTARLLSVAVDVPIVATLAEGLREGPTALLIGIAPPGGGLPEAWRPVIQDAIAAGLNIISGLHTMLGDDPELARLAEARGVRLMDLRRPPEGTPIARAAAARTRARRVLTVGSDCNVGKMVAALEIVAAARAAGLDARFLATGQTGMLLSEGGVAIDRVIGDFMAGTVEQLVLDQGDADLVVVEGQGSITHPAYSGVTLALLHGALPNAMVLCHQPGRATLRNQEAPVPPLPELVRLYEAVLRPLHPGRVVGLALNGVGLTDEELARAVGAAEAETGLPAVDVLRHGAGRLVSAIHERPGSG
jgi:uncharacterized NAD-dependent epimerase/dehydratase family protein